MCVSGAQEAFNLAHSLGIYYEGQWKVTCKWVTCGEGNLAQKGSVKKADPLTFKSKDATTYPC